MLLVFVPLALVSASADAPKLERMSKLTGNSVSTTAGTIDNGLPGAISLSGASSYLYSITSPSSLIMSSEGVSGALRLSSATSTLAMLTGDQPSSASDNFPAIMHLLDIERAIASVIEYSDFEASNAKLFSSSYNDATLVANPRLGQNINPAYLTLKDLSNSQLDNLYPVDLNKMKLGNLISDYVLEDYAAMSEYDIRLFLDAQGRGCTSVAGGVPCLKDYRGDIPKTPAGERAICSEIAEEKNATAARMLYLVANACGVNPQTLIVHMQKEQGLVESNSPTKYMYQAAMGFNCPDSRGCGKSDFWQQLRKSAEQKMWYGHPDSNFSRYKPGKTITLSLSPKAQCGSKTFLLENKATASLYYYTPYAPDSAAIRAYSGVGGECSSYGNRNFYRLFNQWFGDSTYSPSAQTELTKEERESNKELRLASNEIPVANKSLTLSPVKHGSFKGSTHKIRG